MKEWKRWIKGVYDKEGVTPKLLVTGSAKLDTYRKVGDSLAGRYFQYRLYPLDLKEVADYEPSLSLTEDARLENLVAFSLLKALHSLEDLQGSKTALHYLRTKDGKEIDFLVCIDKKPVQILEVKSSDDTPASGFHHFMPYFKSIQAIQLVRHCAREETFSNGIEVRSLIPWLAQLTF